MLNVKQLPAKIESIKAYSDKLRVFRLRLSRNDGFSFVPGQFVMLSLPGLVDSNGRKIAKAYSIASSPSEQDVIDLCIVNYPNGVLSTPLFKLNVGDEVIITGPYGMFQLKKPVGNGTVFIAGGTGLAPLIGMLRSLYAEGYKEKLWLFYSVSEPKLFMFREELLRYSKNKGLKLVVSTSNPDSSWSFEKGRVTSTLPKFASEISREVQFYLCGPPEMVTDIIKVLEQLGFKKENIHKEQW
ncbi:FAD-dependent oxidoreductase [Candidatus Woesearchaeota archaeon]|nr:FAD-dependent oxidoreductase [Candidatus Woesearchaeota archaeon]